MCAPPITLSMPRQWTWTSFPATSSRRAAFDLCGWGDVETIKVYELSNQVRRFVAECEQSARGAAAPPPLCFHIHLETKHDEPLTELQRRARAVL